MVMMRITIGEGVLPVDGETFASLEALDLV